MVAFGRRRRRGIPLARGRSQHRKHGHGTSTAGSPGAGRWPARHSPWPGCRCSPRCSTPLQSHLNLSDDLLIYLVAVVAVTVVGGFWPAVVAAVGACLLLNWFFTEPLHTFTIAEPRNLLALVLFVTVAVAVSSVVHLAARREADAARSSKETESLLGLAQTVLGGADTPGDVLDHLTQATAATPSSLSAWAVAGSRSRQAATLIPR